MAADPNERVTVPVGYIDGLRRGWMFLAVVAVVLVVALLLTPFLPGWIPVAVGAIALGVLLAGLVAILVR